MIFWPLLIAGNALSLYCILRESRRAAARFPIATLTEVVFVLASWAAVNSGLIVFHMVMVHK